MARYYIELKCVVDLPDEQDINHLANTSLTRALCVGLQCFDVRATPPRDYVSERRVDIVDGSMSDIERKVKRLRSKPNKKAEAT